MRSVLREVADDRVRAYIVWVPMLAADNEQAAHERSREFADNRLIYFWDGTLLTGESWGRALNLGARKAWDVYFLFGADTRWEDGVPTPDFWMHQLSGITTAQRLDRSKFTVKLKEMLGRLKRL